MHPNMSWIFRMSISRWKLTHLGLFLHMRQPPVCRTRPASVGGTQITFPYLTDLGTPEVVNLKSSRKQDSRMVHVNINNPLTSSRGCASALATLLPGRRRLTVRICIRLRQSCQGVAERMHPSTRAHDIAHDAARQIASQRDR